MNSHNDIQYTYEKEPVEDRDCLRTEVIIACECICVIFVSGYFPIRRANTRRIVVDKVMRKSRLLIFWKWVLGRKKRVLST